MLWAVAQDSPSSTDIPFLFEDQHLVVLNKPAGLLSQGESTGDENLVDLLRVRFGRNYVGLVHRLDRNTSGLMVVAKRSKAANRLTECLQKGKLVRRYLCVVEGKLTAPAGSRPGDRGWTELSHWLVKNEKTNLSKAYRELPPHLARAGKGKSAGRGGHADSAAKEATLRYRLHEVRPTRVESDPVTVLEIDLDTGRSHQIRAQLSAEGHPLLGDVKYGAKRGLPEHRIALHSHSISFPHPMMDDGAAPVAFETGLPDDLARLILTSG